MAPPNLPYTEDEQKKIVDYIVKHDAINQIKGDKLWKDMEKEKVVSRTWQSLKQHFRSRIAYELHYPKYDLSPEIRQQFHWSISKIVKRPNTSRKKKPPEGGRKLPNFSPSFSTSDSDSDLEHASNRRNAKGSCVSAPTVISDSDSSNSTSSNHLRNKRSEQVILVDTDGDSDGANSSSCSKYARNVDIKQTEVLNDSDSEYLIID